MFYNFISKLNNFYISTKRFITRQDIKDLVNQNKSLIIEIENNLKELKRLQFRDSIQSNIIEDYKYYFAETEVLKHKESWKNILVNEVNMANSKFLYAPDSSGSISREDYYKLNTFDNHIEKPKRSHLRLVK